jgi:ABC-type dipeptide/oligopeptide/nickel transport system permease subunit
MIIVYGTEQQQQQQQQQHQGWCLTIQQVDSCLSRTVECVIIMPWLLTLLLLLCLLPSAMAELSCLLVLLLLNVTA